MQDPFLTPKPKPRPKKGVLFCGISCWLVTLISIGFFAWCWKNRSGTVDIQWSIALFGLMIVWGVFLVLFSLKRLLVGPDRFGALVGLFLGTLPLLFWPACHFDAVWRDRSSRNTQWSYRDAPVAIARSAAANLEAQFRYPRRTAGRWVTLIDAGQPDDVQNLLEAMDRHVQDQCDLLGVSPTQPIYWSRGPLLGQSDHAILGWAIGDVSQSNEAVATDSDKQLVSLACLSTILGPDVSPPSLLTRGWARYTSEDRSELRQSLLNAWDDLVTDRTWEKLYQPSSSPHWIDLFAGPVVEFLIEQHGGPRFLEFLRTATPATFTVAYRKVYQNDWKETESQFLQWLQQQHPERQLDVKTGSDALEDPWQARTEWLATVNADGSALSTWNTALQTIMSRYEARFKEQDGAWKSVKEMKQRVAESPGSQLIKNQEIIKILLNDREAWFAQSNQGQSLAIVAANDLCFEATRLNAGSARLGKQVTTKAERTALREQVVTAHRALSLIGDPLESLFLMRNYAPRIESCTIADNLVTTSVRFESSESSTEKTSTEKTPVAVRWVCNLARGGLLESISTQFADGSRTDKELQLYSAEENWFVREITTQRVVERESQIESIQRIDRLESSQRRSFQDELRSINLETNQDSMEMPSWLAQLRLGLLGWSVTAIVLAIAFALLRL